MDAGEFTEAKLYGRGGQGIVTAGKLISLAAVKKGLYAQSIPTFGPERRGGLSTCSLRIGSKSILLKSSVVEPDIVCVFDPTIWHFVNVTNGIKENGILIFNSKSPPGEIHEELKRGKWGYKIRDGNHDIYSLDATSMAMRILGKAITNTAMMSAFSKATGVIDMNAIKDVIKERFEDPGNLQIAEEAFASVRSQEGENGP
jgi:2-oxoacid:acceptor oxidoreductase gamma subunit (pyruvate/2-ketoisovalerate family)